jgi:hypothetical protein
MDGMTHPSIMKANKTSVIAANGYSVDSAILRPLMLAENLMQLRMVGFNSIVLFKWHNFAGIMVAKTAATLPRFIEYGTKIGVGRESTLESHATVGDKYVYE